MLPNPRHHLRILTLSAVLRAVALPGAGADPVRIQEDFSTDPLQAGWTIAGDPSLFARDAVSRTLRVEWNSSRPNSYFARPLSTILSRDDDFAFGFDLNLESIRIGTTPAKPYTFQLAVGLIHWRTATNASFLRGTGFDSPNLVEFAYFPDSGFGATVSPTLISSNNEFAVSFNFPLELVTNAWHRIALSYTASNRTLVGTLTRDGQPLAPLQDAVLSTNFTDFRVDTLAVASYSDEGQDPEFAGSLQARGVLDNVWFEGPAPAEELRLLPTATGWELRFLSRIGWVYALEYSPRLDIWEATGEPTPGTGGVLQIPDSHPPGSRGFYRLQAIRP